MAIASITAWLDNPVKSYHHGRGLYEQYGENKVTLALIRSGSGSFHLAKLIDALQLINKQSNLVPKPIIIPDYVAPAAPAAPGKSNPDFTSAPEQIMQIRDDKNLNFAQARKLHESIRVMDSREHRLAAGLRILDLMDKVNDAWSIIDDWKENGKIREQKLDESESTVAELSLADLLKEAKNLPTYITKDRAKLAAAKTDKDRVDIQLRLEVRIDRLKHIKSRIDAAV